MSVQFLFLLMIFVLFLFGFVKNVIMLLYSWLLVVMVAFMLVSALLHVVVVVKIGVFFILCVILFIFGMDVMC